MKKLIIITLFACLSAQAQYIPSPNNKDSSTIGGMVNNGMLSVIPNKNYSSAPTKIIQMNIRLISTSWYAFPGGNNSGANNSGVCQQQLNTSGMAAQGWILSGTDYCTEDNGTCTVDGLKCYAVKPM
jgi:hypothetical protein